MLRLFSLLCLSISVVSGFAQSNSSAGRGQRPPPIANQFEHLSVKDGLSNNSVNAILQDRNGFMWFGTHEGLNKYDGYAFTVFKPDPARPTRSFRSSNITGLCEGGPDQLWVTTEGGGLHEVNTRTGEVIPHPIRDERAIRWHHQLSAYKDRQNRLWISTFGGVAHYDPARHYFKLYPAPDPDSPVITVFEDRQKQFWVGTLRGVFLLNRETGQFTPVPVLGATGVQPTVNSFYQDKKNGLWAGTATEGYSLLRLNLNQKPARLERYNPGGQLNQYIWRNPIHQDANGLIWLGTTTGLQAVDPVSNRVFTCQTDPNLSKALGSSNAQAVYRDRFGMVWVGTDNGIDRQAATTKPFQSYQLRPNKSMASFPENKVNTLITDSRGQLWFSNSATVFRLSANGQQLTRVSPEKLGTTGDRQNYINALLPDGSVGVWFATYHGLFHFDHQSGQYTRYAVDVLVQFIQRAPNGDLWMGGEGGIASMNPRTHQFTYYKYEPGNLSGLSDKFVHGLMVSRTGDVWVLIKQLGLCRLNPKTGRFTRYQAGTKGHLSSNEVQSIYEDQAGIIWVGTHLGGLNRFDPNTGLFSVITNKDGLPGDNVAAITSDESGNLWLSIDKGICRYNPKTRTIHTYETTDGLPSNDFLQHAVFRQADELFFGSINGLVRFNPNQIQDDTRPFSVCITQLTVLDKPRALTDSVIRLNHDENMVSFGFAALAYEQPSQNQFAYQLVGVNKNWVQNGNSHVASYNNLAPGTYMFRVKAANSDGFWTKNPGSVQVIIRPPWWATWWAYGLYVLLAGGAIWGYIQFYTNRIRQQQESELNRRKAEQLKAVDELKSRFFSNITHEFRTPLTLIISPVEKLLQQNRFDRPLLTTVQRNADQLLRLINQLLDLSKLEGNFMAVSLRQGEVTAFVSQQVEVFRRAAEQKSVTLTCSMADFPSQDYLFDADKWEKIITNILSNAIKFTESGGRVTVATAPVWADDRLTAVQIEITDSGIGIDSESLPHIFDRFYQRSAVAADTSSTRAYFGTGIGLALVKELIDLLGGSITVASVSRVGTTFRLTLPVASVVGVGEAPRIGLPESNLPDVVSQFSPVPASLNKHLVEGLPLSRVLVVEDNEELREFLIAELSNSYQIFEAADGEQGWAITQTELPDLVLTDVMMPRMDGHELTRLIKTHADTDHIGVVMLTAKSAQHSRIEGLQRGADDYLSKPFNLEELHLRLANLISHQQKLGEHYRQQLALPRSLPETIGAVAIDPFLNRIYGLLDSDLDNPSLGVDWLADQLAMSRKTLYRKVQTVIQLSPADLIRQYRLRRAAELLRAGHTVSETADLVGFSTPSYFSLAFREFYHKTPTDFVANQVKQV
jgi:signal transduction histidine kinase/ligand-binding sensor domain-containing protein/CheY-like chemotaxis protein